MSHLASFDLIILFFLLGVLASWVKSDLAIPEQVSKFLSIFLLISLGLKGGQEVRNAQNLVDFFPTLTLGLSFCIMIPIFIFFSLRKKLGISNASAIAASYGSVSAVTFITAQSLLENKGIESSGYMVAIMALMEIPAILVAVYFYNNYSKKYFHKKSSLLLSIFSTKSVVILIGGFLIGLLMNEVSWKSISPVFKDNFKGVLAFFLLDLGIIAQKQIKEAWGYKTVAILVAIVVPLFFGTLALIIGHSLGLPLGDQILIAVLTGSGSYIAAPATVRSTMPEANPSLYLAMPLALTFPVNLIFGIPFYIQLSNFLALS